MFHWVSLIFDRFLHWSSLEFKTILRPFWALMSSAWPKIVGRRPGLCWRRSWRITKAFTFPAGAANLAFGVAFPCRFQLFFIDFHCFFHWFSLICRCLFHWFASCFEKAVGIRFFEWEIINILKIIESLWKTVKTIEYYRKSWENHCKISESHRKILEKH